jgi:hypothetical protein
VSDQLAGRRLGRPSGHFGWSLTPRNCCWRPLWQWRHQAGGTERCPRTTGFNLHDGLQLSCGLAARQSCSSTRTNPRSRRIQGEHLARRGCSPPVFPPGPTVSSCRCRSAYRASGLAGMSSGATSRSTSSLRFARS